MSNANKKFVVVKTKRWWCINNETKTEELAIAYTEEMANQIEAIPDLLEVCDLISSYDVFDLYPQHVKDKVLKVIKKVNS